jgi:hypothetical protein
MSNLSKPNECNKIINTFVLKGFIYLPNQKSFKIKEKNNE